MADDGGVCCMVCFQSNVPLAELRVAGRHRDAASACKIELFACQPCWQGWVAQAGFLCPLCRGALKTRWLRKPAAVYLRGILMFLFFLATSVFSAAMEGCMIATVLYFGNFDFPLVYYISATAGLLRVRNQAAFRKVYGNVSGVMGATVLVVFGLSIPRAMYLADPRVLVYSAGLSVCSGMACVTFYVLLKTFLPWYTGVIPLSAYKMYTSGPGPDVPPARYNLRPQRV